MSTAFTPGPWTACFQRLNGSVTGWHITAMPHGSLDAVATADLSGELRGPDEEEANARLIAASPALLDAAQAAEAVLGRQKWLAGSTDPEAVALFKLRAAIEKAIGAKP